MNGETPLRRFAGGAALYLLLISLLVKVIRAYDLYALQHGWKVVATFPVTLGTDILLSALLGLLFVAISRPSTRYPRVAAAAITAVTGAWALVQCANILSYRLSGSALTLPRLQGQDGATLADLDLLDPWDLAPMVVLTVAAVCGAWFGSRLLARLRWSGLLASSRALAVLAALGAGLYAADTLALSRWTSGLGENPAWAFVADLLHSDEDESLALAGEQWRKLTATDAGKGAAGGDTPVHDGHARNVIVFLGEGVPLKHTSFGGSPVDPTPAAAQRAKEGVYFSRYYSTYHKSIHALFSIACSEYPPPSPKTIVQFNPRIACREVSQVLSEHGFVSGLFHGGRFKFYDKLSFFGDRGYSKLADAADMKDGDKWMEDRWGIDDRAMVDEALEWFDTLDPGQRFFALVVPLSPHYPYHLPKDVGTLIHGNGALDKFLNAVRFEDDVFERLMAGLEERELADDTLVVYLADHGNYVEEPARESPGLRLFYEANVHVPLAFLCPSIFPEEGQVSDRPGGHIDLVPTILDLVGVALEPTHKGQSLFSPTWEERRVFIAADRGGKRFVGFIEGDRKFVQEIGTSHAEYYDLASDPDELENLASDFPDLVEKYAKDAETFAKAQMTLLQGWPQLEKRVTVQQEVLARGKFRLRTEKHEVECKLRGRSGTRHCAGYPKRFFPRIQKQRVGKKERVCIATHIPEQGGSMEVSVGGDVLRRMSGVRIGIPDRFAKRSTSKVSIAVDVDGRRVVNSSLTDSRNVAELDFPHEGDSLRIVVSATDGANRPICLMFSDSAWYNRE